MFINPTAPRPLLRLEGLMAAVLALIVYREIGASWWLFAGLFLVPDVSIPVYLAGKRIGALAYNTVHTYALPGVLFGLGFLSEGRTAMAVALIWIAHIGLDRVLGLGLKYPTGFKDTHLHRVG
ncbi:MAG: DUF4260 domain-containing protein [Gemmatimonadales bacterium]